MLEKILCQNVWPNAHLPVILHDGRIKFKNQTYQISAVYSDFYMGCCYFLVEFILEFRLFAFFIIWLFWVTGYASIEISWVKGKVFEIGLFFFAKKSLIESLIADITSLKGSFENFFHFWTWRELLFFFWVYQVSHFL